MNADYLWFFRINPRAVCAHPAKPFWRYGAVASARTRLIRPF
jgi:hypothetical protein